MNRLLAGAGWALLGIACGAAVLLGQMAARAPLQRAIRWGVGLVEKAGGRVL